MGLRERTTSDGAAVVGDDAWFRDAYPRLRRFAAVVAPPTVVPDDLVQDALVRVLRRGPLTELDDPTAYLCRTMANLASDSRRRWLRGRAVSARLGLAPTGHESTYPSDLSDLELLSPRERGAMYLHDVEGRTFDEAAALLGCTPAAARKAASRGRARLRDLIEATP